MVLSGFSLYLLIRIYKPIAFADQKPLLLLNKPAGED